MAFPMDLEDTATTDEALRCVLVEAIAQIEREIVRVEHSQETMRLASAALLAGDDDRLRAMQFAESHIAEMSNRMRELGAAFPPYVVKNNERLMRCLKRKREILVNRLTALNARAGGRASVPYRCEAESPYLVPFFAAFAPYIP